LVSRDAYLCLLVISGGEAARLEPSLIGDNPQHWNPLLPIGSSAVHDTRCQCFGSCKVLLVSFRMERRKVLAKFVLNSKSAACFGCTLIGQVKSALGQPKAERERERERDSGARRAICACLWQNLCVLLGPHLLDPLARSLLGSTQAVHGDSNLPTDETSSATWLRSHFICRNLFASILVKQA